MSYTKLPNGRIVLEMDEHQYLFLKMEQGLSIQKFLYDGNAMVLEKALEYFNDLHTGNPDFVPVTDLKIPQLWICVQCRCLFSCDPSLHKCKAAEVLPAPCAHCGVVVEGDYANHVCIQQVSEEFWKRSKPS